MPTPTVREPISPWPVAGLVGMACVAFLVAVTVGPLGVPWWAVLGLAVVWLVALVQSLRWFTRRPRTVVLLPVLVALVWFATIVAGSRYLDWLNA